MLLTHVRPFKTNKVRLGQARCEVLSHPCTIPVSHLHLTSCERSLERTKERATCNVCRGQTREWSFQSTSIPVVAWRNGGWGIWTAWITVARQRWLWTRWKTDDKDFKEESTTVDDAVVRTTTEFARGKTCAERLRCMETASHGMIKRISMMATGCEEVAESEWRGLARGQEILMGNGQTSIRAQIDMQGFTESVEVMKALTTFLAILRYLESAGGTDHQHLWKWTRETRVRRVQVKTRTEREKRGPASTAIARDINAKEGKNRKGEAIRFTQCTLAQSGNTRQDIGIQRPSSATVRDNAPQTNRNGVRGLRRDPNNLKCTTTGKRTAHDRLPAVWLRVHDQGSVRSSQCDQRTDCTCCQCNRGQASRGPTRV